MTREEAIKELSYIADEMPSMECAIWLEAISMAIKALEQEPCADAISRQAVDDAIYDYSRSCDVNYAQIMEYIEKIPSIKPQYTDAEIQKMQDLEFAEIQKAYEIGKDEGSEVLDKIRAEITNTLYIDSLIFGELIDFRNGKISADDVIEEFNRVTRAEVLQIIDKYKASPTGSEEVEE